MRYYKDMYLNLNEDKSLQKHMGGVVGGHYAGWAEAQKILHFRLWWPTLHQDLKAYCRACDICQQTGKPSRRDEMPLNP